MVRFFHKETTLTRKQKTNKLLGQIIGNYLELLLEDIATGNKRNNNHALGLSPGGDWIEQ